MAVALAAGSPRVARHHGGDPATAAIGPVSFSAGSLLIAGVCQFEPGSGHPTLTSVAISGNQTATFQVDYSAESASQDSRLSICSLANITGGSCTVTATGSSNSKVVLYLMEVTGAATSSYTDGTGAAASSSGANPASGNFNASVTDGFWFAVFGDENGGSDTTIAAGSGWTLDATNGRTTDGTQDVVSGVEYRANPGSTGPFNGNFTAASAAWHAAVFVYKAAGGAPVIALEWKQPTSQPTDHYVPGVILL